MAQYNTIQIIDFLNGFGEDTKNILSDFSCDKNLDIEHFLKKNSIEFAKKKQSITHLVFDDENGELVGYFSLTHKPIIIEDEILSNKAYNKILRFAKPDKEGKYTLSAFLIAQFGKNYSIEKEKQIDGKELMSLAYNILKEVQYQIGGIVVFLECEEKKELLEFYQREPFSFKIFGERISETDNTKYIQLLSFIK